MLARFDVVPAYGPRGWNVFDRTTGNRVVNPRTKKFRNFASRIDAEIWIACWKEEA